MGLGNKLIVSATGFPGTNKTLRFIQDAFFDRLGALAKLAGNKAIISGVVINSGVVSDGFITYNDEIIPFKGGNISETVTIIEEFENVNYNTDANDDTVLDSLPAYRTIYAKCGTGGIDIFNFSELQRLKTIEELSDFELPANVVIDANYVHTDNNFTVELLQKLNGIQAGAEQNVQSDWSNTISSSDAFIKNKPFQSLKFTYGSQMVGNAGPTGDFSNDYTRNLISVYPPAGFAIADLVAFMPSIGKINFAGNVNNDDVLWCRYQVQTANNRVVAICANSEMASAPIINYIAIWMK